MDGNLPAASDVAAYFIHLAAADDDSEFVSNMRLQKLLYYAQGWSLAIRGRRMFDEPIEAWVWGPVVPSVFRTYKPSGRHGIEPEDDYSGGTLSDEDRAFLDRVWDTYKDYSAIRLSQMTHEEPPWQEARGGLPATASCKSEITTESLDRFFSSLLNEEADGQG